MPVIYQKFINRVDLQANPEVLYLFGDNTERWGTGGQAGHMRGEPNAIGIATKWTPTQGSNAYFNDDDYAKILPIVWKDFEPVFSHLEKGGLVVVPLDGLGTGLSELPTRAPKINAALEQSIKDLEQTNMRL